MRLLDEVARDGTETAILEDKSKRGRDTAIKDPSLDKSRWREGYEEKQSGREKMYRGEGGKSTAARLAEERKSMRRRR
ncbi:hypothetical protein BJX65DRAFT_210498 [Aspergillus insuetus]